ncbi:DoxX family protein [Arthrobacter sp. ISL-30]|uniref:DoxX family protein n=1 Tax=Arthrobacter sp. ISL-30 TaxID=2819109 RepID=UPI001BE6A8C6|nr:DoxX family protein [Arthrobacter sp. ISL-30]MBT2514746.1 DoxX family protein [Arthrobacter sp. ISL-30]
MTIVLWVITALLTLVFLAAGAMKIAQPKANLAASGQGWVEDFSDRAVKYIGAIEILGALGLVLPAVLNIATDLVPAAAIGLFLLMTGAVITHARRRETPNVVINIVLAVLAAGIAIARFGPYSF